MKVDVGGCPRESRWLVALPKQAAGSWVMAETHVLEPLSGSVATPHLVGRGTCLAWRAFLDFHGQSMLQPATGRTQRLHDSSGGHWELDVLQGCQRMPSADGMSVVPSEWARKKGVRTGTFVAQPWTKARTAVGEKPSLNAAVSAMLGVSIPGDAPSEEPEVERGMITVRPGRVKGRKGMGMAGGLMAGMMCGHWARRRDE